MSVDTLSVFLFTGVISTRLSSVTVSDCLVLEVVSLTIVVVVVSWPEVSFLVVIVVTVCAFLSVCVWSFILVFSVTTVLGAWTEYLPAANTVARMTNTMTILIFVVMDGLLCY